MIADDDERDTGKRYMDCTPDTNNPARPPLARQRLHQDGAPAKGFVGALKVEALVGRDERESSLLIGRRERLQAIRFEGLGLSRAQALNGVLKLKDALFERAYNADAIGTRFVGN